MSVLCSCCLLWITLFFQDTDAAARFTQVPPSKLYVLKGQTARLVWAYSVDNRQTEFFWISPWWFYVDNNVRHTIGYDNGYDGWKFQISNNTCPPRLLKPTVRVSRENQATLVIKNVSTDDNGIYGCVFLLRNSIMLNATTQLVVTDAAARFTQVPPSKLYVVKGETARLVWAYSVDNRQTEYFLLSPIWYYVVNNVSYIIGWDNGYDGWKFEIFNNSGSLRLLRPTVRVSRENQSTLVIKNVSTDDNGIYGCVLFLRILIMLNTTTQLVVTETPRFTVKPNTITTITEHSVLNLNCTAVGPPSPNVTWINPVIMESIVHGNGSAVLRIPNVNRSHNGTKYECQASNNPNEDPVRVMTTVVVYYYKNPSSRSCAQEIKDATIAAGLCASLFAISFIVNILLVVYVYRVKTSSINTMEATHDTVEMATQAAPPPSYVNEGLASQPSAEYEPVTHTNTIPSTGNSTYEIPGNQQTSENNYQQLNPETMQHDPTAQYEPLRTQHVTTDQRNDTYEPLRNRPTEYQSLQKYSNA